VITAIRRVGFAALVYLLFAWLPAIAYMLDATR
jgi:hypothetical protein